MRAGFGPGDHALVDLDPVDVDFDFVAGAIGKLHIAEVDEFPRPVSVVAPKATAGIVKPAVLVSRRLGTLHHVRIETDTLLESQFVLRANLLHNPVQRNLRQRIVGIAAADVGMDAGEPDLGQLAFRNAILVPENGMKGGPFVIEREGVARLQNALLVKGAIWKLEWPDPFADASGQFIDRRPVRRNRVPETEKRDLDVLRLDLDFGNGVALEQASDPTDQGFHAPSRLEFFLSIGAVGKLGVSVEFFVSIALHEALAQRQPCDYPHRVGAAAEPKSIYSVAGLVVPAQKFIERQNVSPQSPAKCASEDCKRLESRCAYAVVVAGDLIAVRKIETFKHAPDIGSPDLSRRITGAV